MRQRKAQPFGIWYYHTVQRSSVTSARLPTAAVLESLNEKKDEEQGTGTLGLKQGDTVLPR